MNRVYRVAVTIGVASAALTGCSQAEEVPGPSSTILPAVTFPADSKMFNSESDSPTDAGLKIEQWAVPLSVEKATDYLREQLPIGRSFDSAPYEGENAGIDKSGHEEITWNWEKEESAFISVSVSEFNPKRDGYTFVQLATAKVPANS
jgi:hypothetical protein